MAGSARVNHRSSTSRIALLPIARLVPSSDNRRKSFTATSLATLAKSIKAIGVIEPLVVRVHPKLADRWEIRAGERRWRAAKLAGCRVIPAIVRALDDATALSVTLAENTERVDLHPLEEAEAIQLAFDRNHDLKAIASNLGRSLQFVARRASLTRLTSAWRKLVFSRDSEASRLSAAHLELIARLPATTQDALAGDGGQLVFGRGFPTVKELCRTLDRELTSLQAMPWLLDDETLVAEAGSCQQCSKRSGMQPLLFAADDAPKNGRLSPTDRCLDRVCWERKLVAHLRRCEADLRRHHPELVLIHTDLQPLSSALRESFGDSVQHCYCPQFVKASQSGAKPVMPVDGPKLGKLVYLESSAPECPSAGARHNSTGKARPLTLTERRERLERRRDAFFVEAVESALREVTPERLAQSHPTEPPPVGETELKPMALLLAFGTNARADSPYGVDGWARYRELLEIPPEMRVATALYEVAQVWIRRLATRDRAVVAKQAAEARLICPLVGLDAATIETEARTRMPEPAGWAKLNATEAQGAAPVAGKRVRNRRR